MPRPKVRPELRQRAVQACIPCKTSKKRCDARRPCSNCCRRGCEPTCVFEPNHYAAYSRGVHNRTSPNTRLDLPPARTSVDDMDDMMRGGAVALADVEAPRTPESSLPTGSEETPAANDDPRAPMSHREAPRGRMMFNSKGEKVYVGHSASLSFLHFLRRTLLHYMGPSRFTGNIQGDVMLEVVAAGTTPGTGMEDSCDEITMEAKRDYVTKFYAATAGIIYLFEPEEMYDMLQQPCGSPEDADTFSQSAMRAAIVDLAIAIGSQSGDTSPSGLQHSQRHFARSQNMAFQGMLLDPSVDLICVFLLMSFYMLGACRRNGAFMYLGVAARSAHALGMHVPESYHHLDVAEQDFRLRVWKSLRVLDIAVGSILSRPPATSPRGQSLGTYMDPEGKSNLSPEMTCMTSSFEVCTVLEEIMHHLDHKRDVNIASIQRLLTQLRLRSQSLPSELRFSTTEWPMSAERQRQALGSSTVACIYYFSVILITRPVLISWLLRKLTAASQGSSSHTASPKVEEIAQVCVDAAVLMAETARSAQAAGILLQNMCMLKAWLFSAGLILGFTLFVEATPSLEIEPALLGAIDVMKDLAKSSSQAQHYSDILSDLHDAIKKNRDRMFPPRRRTHGQYLSQIFVMDKEARAGPSDAGTSSAPNAADSMDGNENAGLWMLHQAAEASQNQGEPWLLPDVMGSGVPGAGVQPGGFDLDWGDISVQITENSLFETDSLLSLMDPY
ncbi:hypothetical protein S40293_03774 [Stachybotrys chartarum IBT 40293]|nr:hypothetical protein S40293_03774 [Stachybotrys chartarum IBT 40293]